jgi:hypothetical protein
VTVLVPKLATTLKGYARPDGPFFFGGATLVGTIDEVLDRARAVGRSR